MTTVMIVDDDDDIRDALREMLECEGFATIDVRNGKEAIAVLERSSPVSLIIIDLVMPVMGGWELLDVLSMDRSAGVEFHDSW